MTARQWAGFIAVACAGALAYRGDWRAAAIAAVAALVPVAAWVRGEVAAGQAAARALLREAPKPEPRPVPRLVREPRPPWESAQMPAVPARPVPGYDGPKVAKWQQQARVRMP